MIILITFLCFHIKLFLNLNQISTSCQCAGDSDIFIQSVFRECRSGSIDVSIFALQMLSTITFVIAYYPQVRLNFLVKDTDVAIGLILSWTFADTISFISMILQNALQTQIVLQTYFTIIVYTLLIQYIIYKPCRSKKVKPLSPELRTTEIIFYSALVVVVIVGIAMYYWQNKQVIELLDRYEPVSEDTHCVKIQPSTGARLKAGNILSYISIPFFPLSRILQIIQNVRTKKTEYLSITMFIINSIGNLSQTISLIIDSIVYERITEQIAYICNTFLPLVLDVVILIQSIYYNKKREKLVQNYSIDKLVIAEEGQQSSRQTENQTEITTSGNQETTVVSSQLAN